MSPADSVVRSLRDKFSSRSSTTVVIDAESFINTTSQRGGVRFVDEGLDSIWHDVDEFVGGEKGEEGRGEEWARNGYERNEDGDDSCFFRKTCTNYSFSTTSLSPLPF